MKKFLLIYFTKRALSLIISLSFAGTVCAQNVTVNGLVTDKSGGVLPGVTVINKGSLTGTVTDIDGKYRIEVEEDATLAFSFVGYLTQAVPIGTPLSSGRCHEARPGFIRRSSSHCTGY